MSRSNKLARLPISQKWMYVLSLHLSGRPIDEIAEKSGYAVQTVRQILSNDKVNEIRQMLLEDTQKEFEALFGPIVGKIRDMLDAKDTAVDAINLWIKMHGRGGKQASSTTNTTNITAEDIVFNILNNNNNNKQDNPPQTPPSSVAVGRGTRDE